VNSGDIGLSKQNEVIRKHEMSEIQCLAMRMMPELRVGASLQHKSGKVFHGEHKKEGRQGVTLSQASTPLETAVNATVDVERVLHIGNTGHNPFGEKTRKAQCVEQVLQEIPVDRVEGFPQIHFEHASRGGVFPEVTPGQVLTDEDIEKDFPSRDESTLTLID